MHQTFYIDADEEISSVIDRLNKSVSLDNYFVVPKRAIFLQSIVNLKLLKREADKLSKRLVIITQDEIGASMAERSGLEVRSALEEAEVETLAPPVEVEKIFEEEVQEVNVRSRKSRLSDVGSSEFYDSTGDLSHVPVKVPAKAKVPAKKIPVNSVNSVSHAKSVDHIAGGRIPQHQLGKVTQQKTGMYGQLKNSAKSLYGNKIDPEKEKSLEKMFSAIKPPEKKAEQKVVQVSSFTKKIFLGFVVLCLFIFAGVATYLFLPSAKIIITPNVITEKTDINISGSGDISQIDQTKMPVQIIDKSDSISLSYDVSGTSTAQGKKAHGSVVLYNEFSDAPQTLIATTRIESADGKIFRLVKNVVVPGTTNIGGQIKPGVIEAEVIADAPGSDYNLAPTTFKIPGFSGSPKFDKFYAKSTADFIGGSSDGVNAPGAVTQRDLDLAKQKTEQAIKEKMMQDITDGLGGGDIALEQAEKITITKSGTSAKVGDTTGKFDYIATASIHALVFAEADVKNIIKQSFKDNQDLKGATWDVSKVEYGASVADFDKNTLELKVHGEVTALPIIDAEKIKQDLLGKKSDQLDGVLRNYPSIKNINVEFKMSFTQRIPQYAGRVSVEIEKTQQ